MGPSARRGSRAIAGRAHSNGQDGVGSQGLGQLGGAGKELKREELSTLRINPAFEMLRTQMSSCTDSFFETRSILCIRNIPANSFASSCVSVPHHTCLKRMSKCRIFLAKTASYSIIDEALDAPMPQTIEVEVPDFLAKPQVAVFQ